MPNSEIEASIPTQKDGFLSKLSNIFVGREKQLQQLTFYLHQTEKQSGNFIVITGEAGIGKTCLVHHFLREAHKKGAITIHESFKHEVKYNPYAPFFRIIKRLMPYIRKPNTQVYSELSTLCRAGNGNGNGNGNGIGKKFDTQLLYSLQTNVGLVQQKIVSTFLQAAQENVVVVFLSDIHLATQTAWQFIHYLSKSFLEHKIMIVVTLRLDGKEKQQKNIPVYVDILQRMNSQRLVKKMNVGRFTKEHIRTYVNQLFIRSDFSSEFLPLLYEFTGGLPKTLVRCMDVMFEQHMIYERDGIWFNQETIRKEQLGQMLFDKHQHPLESIQLSTLSTRQLQLLNYMSLMKDSVDYPVFSELMNIPQLDIARELIHLRDQKIITENGENRFCFKQSVFATMIKKQIPEDDQKTLHQHIAETIEKTDLIKNNEKYYPLFHHYSKTDHIDKIFEYLRKAFDLALANFAFTEARDFFNCASQLIRDNKDRFKRSDILNILLKMIWLDRILGNYYDSIKLADFSLDLCAAGQYQNERDQILIQKGFTYFRLNRWQEATNCFQTCLNKGEHTQCFIPAMAHYGLGNICLEMSKYDQASHHYHTSLNLAKKINTKPLLISIYNNLGIIEHIQRKELTSVAHYCKNIPFIEKLGDGFAIAKIYFHIGMTYAREKCWEKANEFYGKSLRASDLMGLIPLKSLTFLNRALALIHLKQYAEAKEYNFKAHRLLKRLNDTLGLAEYHKIQGILERELKNWQQAKKHFESANRKFLDCGNKLGVADTSYEMALLALAQQDMDLALDCLQKARRDFQNLGLIERINMVEKKISKYRFNDHTNRDTKTNQNRDYKSQFGI